MAKPIKIWSGSEWVDVAVSIPNLSEFATTSSVTSAISAHESDTTNIHGIANTANLVTSSTLSATIDNEELLIIAGAL